MQSIQIENTKWKFSSARIFQWENLKKFEFNFLFRIYIYNIYFQITSAKSIWINVHLNFSWQYKSFAIAQPSSISNYPIAIQST